jgi:hypothetical protein
MSDSERPRLVELPSCPLLGLPDDPVTRFSFPSVAHRCRATDRPRPIDLAHQAAFCLAATYPDCPRYQAAAAPRPSVAAKAARPSTETEPGDPVAVDRPRPGVGTAGTLRASHMPGPNDATQTITAAGSPGAPDRPAMPWTHDRAARPVSPGPIAAPNPTDPPKTAGEKMRWRRPLVVAIAIAIVVLLAAAAYLASPAIGDKLQHWGPGASAASPAPLASRSAMPAPSVATPSPGSSRSPGPSQGAGPTAAPTPARTPFIHVVARGEYLNGIAARYGVPVDAIVKVNRITDPSLIYVGERLIIPRP